MFVAQMTFDLFNLPCASAAAGMTTAAVASASATAAAAGYDQ